MRTLSRVVVAVLATGLAACAQQPKEDPKVAQLQQELESVKKQLATTQQAQAATAEGQAAATSTAVETAKSAQQTATSAEQSAAAAQKTATGAATQAEQAARDRQATEKALADQSRAINEQKTAAARQADENARLRQEIDEMKPRQFTLPAGTVIPVRNTSELSTAKLKDGSVFDAVLEKDIVAGGTTLAKAGSLVTCVVVSSDPGGRVKGKASLTVAARTVHAVGGNTFSVKTDSYSTEAGSTTKKDTIRTGIATGAGAIIGGIAGGGKGAAIGAGVGAGAGVGTAMATRGDAAVIPTETLMEFTLSAPATVILRK